MAYYDLRIYALNHTNSGYQAKWIKCAARSFVAQYLAGKSYSEQLEYLSSFFPGQRFIGYDGWDTMTKREQKGCRFIERRIKKGCVSHSQFPCVKLADDFKRLRRNGGHDGHSDHVIPGQLTLRLLRSRKSCRFS